MLTTLAFDELDTFPGSARARADHAAQNVHPSLRQVVSCAEHLGGLVAGLDADQVPLSEALRWWETFDRIERLAAAAETLLAGRVEQSRTWQRSGCRSAAEQLARISGTGIGRARDQLATSKALGRLPVTRAAVRAGNLSGAQASEVTAAAAVNPAAERRLLDVASHNSLAELHNEALRAKAAGDPDPDSTYRRIHTNRQLRTFTDSEGAWNLRARGPAHTGALIERALDELIDGFYRARRTTEHEPREAYAYDALLGLAGDSPGNARPTQRPPQPPFTQTTTRAPAAQQIPRRS
ncbi:MAG: 13E12 repeat family protein [Acidimicrobiia bacterium]|nr:13E12 repeat family protein [Acidimicrobiia bacterium]